MVPEKSWNSYINFQALKSAEIDFPPEKLCILSDVVLKDQVTEKAVFLPGLKDMHIYGLVFELLYFICGWHTFGIVLKSCEILLFEWKPHSELWHC